MARESTTAIDFDPLRHMSEITSRLATRFGSAKTIGEFGSTGRSTGPHCTMKENNDEAVDPQRIPAAGIQSAISKSAGPGYSTSSTFSGPPPKAFCANAACMNSSRSPSSTPAVFDVETPVRRSFTI